MKKVLKAPPYKVYGFSYGTMSSHVVNGNSICGIDRAPILQIAILSLPDLGLKPKALCACAFSTLSASYITRRHL